ncbi:hypothetical protein [Adhaeribacter aerolatus]|uniref:hypothetical protein n=1 Tax=Adhaeribacter aerolatus TaxID=670289 RepID=UPI0011BF0927|nr:hypothetical protein [Adhaeribacter aerolatus]
MIEPGEASAKRILQQFGQRGPFGRCSFGFPVRSIPTQEERKDEQPEWPNGARRPGGFLGF